MPLRNHSVKALCLVGALLFLFVQAQGQFPTLPASTITGYVFNSERRPIAQVQVELIGDVDGILQRMRTDDSGRYLFRGVTQGRFQIRVRPLGTIYEEQTQDVELAGMSASGRPIRDTIQKDFYLSPIKPRSASTAGAIFVQEIPEEAKAVYQRAVSDLDGNRLEAGVAELEDAVRLFPTYYLALERLGLIYTTQQKYEKAVGVFGKAVAVNSRSFNGWYGLSCAYYALKQSDPAVEAAKKAVNLNSSSDDAFLILGLSLRQAKRYEEAEKPLRQADKITKGLSPDVHWHLALLYAKNLNRFPEAADELELYLKTTPDTSQAENIKKLIKKYRETPPPK
ncbi:MAG: anaphase-promoting complex subunit 3 [Blastocatellia bacterium]|nr:anaphase-promoting complex subunit 3 [Blastocatellia bacterium]